MSTPGMLRLPDGVRRATVDTPRGTFAALEALPVAGVCERQPALLIPGYTGSKEDFLPVLGPLAAAGRRVVAIDMRGQFESPAAVSGNGYSLPELAADMAVIAQALAAPHIPAAGGHQRTGHDQADHDRAGYGQPVAHVLGHSFGGLVARELMLGRHDVISSLTLMSSGPGALTGPRADLLRAALTYLDGASPGELPGRISQLWDMHLQPAAVADGVPAEIIEFLRTRLLRSCPAGLRAMGESILACPDLTPALARRRQAPVLVIYGENDDAWLPAAQEDMAQRLGAQRVCIPGAAHSPAVEAPETVASTLTAFWNSVECRQRRPGSASPSQGARAGAASAPSGHNDR